MFAPAVARSANNAVKSKKIGTNIWTNAYYQPSRKSIGFL